MPIGYWCLVLHAHLPFVRHPEHPEFLEEEWFFEALTETYVPLLRVLDGLAEDGVEFRLTLSLSPTLLSMMRDPLLVERYQRHLARLIALAERELRHPGRAAQQRELARYYHDELVEIGELFGGRYRTDLPAAFAQHRDTGRLELLTCAATHGFLPLLEAVPQAVRAQVSVGAAHHRGALGRAASGMWLPECGYAPGVESSLREAGIQYAFLESHGVLHADPRPSAGVYAPIVSPGGVAFFARDPESSRQVWSAEVGYPGDPAYREFYRDIGLELAPEELAAVSLGGERRSLGLKFHRVTGPVALAEKRLYEPAAAVARAQVHARHFLAQRREQVRRLAGSHPVPPLVVSPYDAELFGHWWYEGPRFLDFLLRDLAEQNELLAVTPSEYLERHPDCEVAQPVTSSWGAMGYADVWLSEENDWIHPRTSRAAEQLVELARRLPAAEGLEKRALDQAARELLLAQASDWAFILKTGTTVPYARQRVRQHLERFDSLRHGLAAGELREEVVEEIEWRDNVFPELAYRIYA